MNPGNFCGWKNDLLIRTYQLLMETIRWTLIPQQK
jgi:hypothetical protein